VTLNSSRKLRVKGKVCSGSGEGTKFVKLPWVKRQINEKLGFVPYPGTLNIKLSEGNISLKKLLRKAKPIEISPATGFCRGRCFQAYFMDNLECAIVIPEIRNYPEDTIEVIAPINLREKFRLQDDDVVKINIMV